VRDREFADCEVEGEKGNGAAEQARRDRGEHVAGIGAGESRVPAGVGYQDYRSDEQCGRDQLGGCRGEVVCFGAHAANADAVSGGCG